MVGRIYARLRHGRFPDDVGLTIAIKTTIVLFEIALTTLIYRAVRAARDRAAAQIAAAAYWINPTTLFITSLGYVDALLPVPATGALNAASRGWPAVAGALLASAGMAKPQGIFVAPVGAVALLDVGGPVRAAAGEISAGLRR